MSFFYQTIKTPVLPVPVTTSTSIAYVTIPGHDRVYYLPFGHFIYNIIRTWARILFAS